MSSTTAHSDLTTSLDGSETADRARRFGGIARLYGAPALAAFEGAHVAVIGIGGVGSWVAEALARSAVGTLTLIDLDNVAESNTNRQIHALDGNYGKPKVEAMAERIAAINPFCDVRLVEDFVEPDNFDSDARRRFRLRDRCDRQRAYEDRADRVVRGEASSR